MEKIKPSNKIYRPEIDGLRAFAVISVIINHFNKELLPNGYLGVDIFFVISGFVITSSLSSRESKDFNDFIISFYQRRLKRIIPALVFFILITGLLISILSQNSTFYLATGISSLFGFSNILLFFKSIDYFANSILYNPFTHTWSLGVEEQFYLFFPLILWFSGFGRKLKKSTRTLFLILLPLTIISLGSFIFLYDKNQPAAYFLMQNRFWEMSMGCLIFLIKDKNNFFIKKISNFSSELILFFLTCILFIPNIYSQYSTIFVVLLTSTFILSIKKGSIIYNIFTKKYIVYLGLISYSLYLWHWGILAISRNTIGIHWWSWPFQVLLILVLSVFSYEYVEKRFKNYKFETKDIKSTFIFLKIIFISTLLLFFVGIAKFLKIIPSISYRSPKGDEIISKNEKCMRGNLESCLNRKNSSKSVFAIGDSHLMNHAPSLRKSFTKLGYQIYFFGDTKHIREIFNSNCASEKCYLEDVNKIKKVLSKNNFSKGDIFIYSLSRNRLYLDKSKRDFKKHYIFDGYSRNGIENLSKIKVLNSAIRDLIRFVSDKKGKFVLIDDIPLACGIKEWSANLLPCEVDRNISIDDRKPLTKLFQEISNDYLNVYYVDPHNYLCKSETCFPQIDDIPLYADNSPHFSTNAKFILVPFFDKEFRLIINK